MVDYLFNFTFEINLNESNVSTPSFDLLLLSDTYADKLGGNYSIFFIVFMSLYSMLILTSLISNPILLVVLLWRRKSQLKFIDVFVSNLSLSDLFLTLFNMPLLLTMLFSGKLPFGSLLCRLGIYSTSCNIYINLLTMAYISVDRYFAITRPVISTNSQLRTRSPNYDYSTRKKMYLALCIIWLVALTISIPQYLFTKMIALTSFDDGIIITQCQHDFPLNLNRHMLLVNFAAQYLIPSLVILFFNGKIIYHLYSNLEPFNLFERETREKIKQSIECCKGFNLFGNKEVASCRSAADSLTRTRNLKKSMKIMFIIIVLFLLSWMPIWIYRILTTFYPLIRHSSHLHMSSNLTRVNCTLDNFIECLPSVKQNQNKTLHSLYVYFVCHLLSMLSVCYNPIIYFWMHKKFRLEVKIMFGLAQQPSKYDKDDERRDTLTRLSGKRFQRGVAKNSSFTASNSKM